MDDEVLDPDVTDDELEPSEDEPTYQDWTELQAPVACSWCGGLVSLDTTEAHTEWHAMLNIALENLRAEVRALQGQETA